MEAVRRWFAGESRPRPDKMRRLAEMLKVDEAWLVLGIIAALTPHERHQRRMAANGAVNLVAGHIQLACGTFVLPGAEEGDTPVYLYAIVGGRQVRLSIALAKCDDTAMASFYVHKEYRRCVVLGAVVRSPPGGRFPCLAVYPDQGAWREARQCHPLGWGSFQWTFHRGAGDNAYSRLSGRIILFTV